jgi:hypothetical protein
LAVDDALHFVDSTLMWPPTASHTDVTMLRSKESPICAHHAGQGAGQLNADGSSDNTVATNTYEQ